MTCSVTRRLALRMSCMAAVSYGVGVAESPPGVAAELARLREENARLAESTSAPSWATAERVPAKELLRRQGIRPIESVDELACPDLFESDEELDEFLAMVYSDRRTGLA